MNAKNIKASEKPKKQFCALAYPPQDLSTGPMHAGSVILLVLKDGEGNLDFFVHPELHTVVADHDLTYLEALLKDFVERAKLHPAALFEQLSSVGAGDTGGPRGWIEHL